jgi:hypothetical protein
MKHDIVVSKNRNSTTVKVRLRWVVLLVIAVAGVHPNVIGLIETLGVERIVRLIRSFGL